MVNTVDEIDARCSASPDDIVVIEGHLKVSCADFIVLVNLLVGEFERSGVPRGARVVVQMTISFELLVVIAAVWKHDCSFVPVAINEPERRFNQIIKGCGAILVVRHSKPRDHFVREDQLADDDPLQLLLHPLPASTSSDISGEAYVIFTSGSTGVPKGVGVGHTALLTYLREATRIYGIGEPIGIAAMNLVPTFDGSLTALISPLVRRVTGVVVDPSISATHGLAAFLEGLAEPVLIKATPSQIRLLGGILADDLIPRLEGVAVIGGESLVYEDIAWLRRSHMRILNEYGPTEATVGCVTHEVSADDPRQGPVPIGRPHRGATVTVEAGGRLCSVGERGELVIAGPCLANGYINSDNSNFETRPSGTVYRTGDQGFTDELGILHYVGRFDGQVKVSGFRVEIGEVEAALRSATCDAGVAVLLEQGALVGYVEDHCLARSDELWAAITECLPVYMQPSAIHFVSTLPMTAHGKVDRAALAETFLEATPPPHFTETVRTHWMAATGAEISSNSRFFDTADSMKALRFTGILSRSLGRIIPPSLIFTLPRFGDFVAELTANMANYEHVDSTGPPEPQSDLTPWQSAILEAERLHPDPGAYTVVSAVSVRGFDSIAALEAAFAWAVLSSDVFDRRITLDRKLFAVGPRKDAHPVVVEVVPGPVSDSDVAIRLAVEQQRRIDVGADRGTCPRILIFPQLEGSAVCAIVAHHCTVDEQSLNLLWHRAFNHLDGRSDATFREFWPWASQWAASGPAAVRANAAADDRAVALCEAAMQPLPVDRQGSRETGVAAVAVANDVTAAVHNLAESLALPSSAIYGAAFVAVVGQIYQKQRFEILMPMTLRRDPSDFSVIGSLVSSVSVVADVLDPLRFPDNARLWHRAVIDAADYAHSDPHRLVAQRLNAGDMSLASSKVSLAFETPVRGAAGPVSWVHYPTADAPAKFDLAMFVLDDQTKSPGQIRVVARGSRAFAERMAGQYVDYLSAAVAGAVQAAIFLGDAALPHPARMDPDLGRLIADLAARIMGSEVSLDDDLISMGARSVDLVMLAHAASQHIDATLTALDVWDYPTPRQLANFVSTSIKNISTSKTDVTTYE